MHWSSWLGLGWYTVHTTLVYDVTPQRTGEVALARTAVVIDPAWLALPVLVAVVIFLWIRRRRRRMRQAYV